MNGNSQSNPMSHWTLNNKVGASKPLKNIPTHGANEHHGPKPIWGIPKPDGVEHAIAGAATTASPVPTNARELPWILPQPCRHIHTCDTKPPAHPRLEHDSGGSSSHPNKPSPSGDGTNVLPHGSGTEHKEQKQLLIQIIKEDAV